MLHGSLLINHHHTILEYQITNEGQGIMDSDATIYAFTVFGTEKSGRPFSQSWEQEVMNGENSAPALVAILMQMVDEYFKTRNWNTHVWRDCD